MNMIPKKWFLTDFLVNFEFTQIFFDSSYFTLVFSLKCKYLNKKKGSEIFDPTDCSLLGSFFA